jgi:hypothetical protein
MPTTCRKGNRLELGRVAALVAAAAGVSVTAARASETETAPLPLAIASRSVVQDRGDWQVEYRIRHEGSTGLILMADEVLVRVEGWVSNSRIPGHAAPRWSAQTISGQSRFQATAEVIASDDEERQCRERASVRIWAEDAEGKPAGRLVEPPGPGSVPEGTSAAILSLAPGSILRVQLRLEHQHVVYGAYDPLLGVRTVELRLGTATLQDTLPLDREQHVAQPPRAKFEVPDEHRDTHYYLSAPDSLHVAAHLQGCTYFRFAEIPVRYDTKMRLRFSYLIAAGTEGTCRARITQFKDSPIAWRVLSEGRRELPLTAVGRWTQVELVFRTEPAATTLALDFRIEGEQVEVGEFWVDDLSLAPVAAARQDP